MGGLEVVDGRFRPIYERACEVLTADDRVVSVGLGGSVAAGTADEWSDLDLQVVTVPERHDEFLAAWPQWLAEITPTVFARTPIAPFIVNTVTDDGLTVDFAVWPGEVPAYHPPDRYAVGMLSSRTFVDIADALEYAVEEQLRGLAGPFISLLLRDEHMRHLTGVPHLLGLLTTVFLAEIGAPPPQKHWNRTFTEEQRDAVAALPPVSATRDGLVDFGLGVAHLLVTRARPLFGQYNREWPGDLARVAAERVRAHVGVDISSWCR